MATNLRLEVLSSKEIGTIYEKCVEFLINKGVKVIDHPKALQMLKKEGAWVNFDDQRVRFSRDIIESALRSVPREILLASSHERYDINITYPRQKFYIGTATGNPFNIEPETNTYRDSNMAYVVEWAQLIEALDEIDMGAFPFPKDAPLQTADIHALKATLENTTKHILIQPYSFDSLEYLLELAVVVAGSKAALRKRPIVNLVSCCLTPLGIKAMDMEAIILATRYEVPLWQASLANMGGTSPITIAGTVLQNGIETLASLVMTQLLKPGNPFIGNPACFEVDMATGRNDVASVEGALCHAACTQFTKEAFKVPTGVFGYSTSSVLPDGQAVIQKLLTGLLLSNAGGDILFECGHLESVMASSLIQLILDNTIAKITRRVNSGVKVDDDTLAWQEILDTVPGGTYLERRHTLKHCRDALRLELFVNLSRRDWVAQGSKDLNARALDKYRELKAGFKPVDLPEEVKKEMELIVKRADEHLVK